MDLPAQEARQMNLPLVALWGNLVRRSTRPGY